MNSETGISSQDGESVDSVEKMGPTIVFEKESCLPDDKERVEKVKEKVLEYLAGEYGFDRGVIRAREAECVLRGCGTTEMVFYTSGADKEGRHNALAICLFKGRINVRQSEVEFIEGEIDNELLDGKSVWIAPPPNEQPVDDVTSSWWKKYYPSLGEEEYYDHIFEYVKDTLAGWEGEISEVKVEPFVREVDGKVYTETVRNVVIRLIDGTLRVENWREFAGWRVGSKLRRVKGQAGIEKVKRKKMG